VNNIAATAASHFVQLRSLHIVFASTSGHTEYVVEALIDSLKSITPGWEIEETMAEKTQPQDLLSGGVLLLASSTWNTGCQSASNFGSDAILVKLRLFCAD
jgi:flavodoxin I